MRVNRARNGAGLTIGIAVLLAAIVFSVWSPLSRAPSLYLSSRMDVVKYLDLTGVSGFPLLGIVTGIVPAFVSGRFPVDLEPMRVDIKFKHLRKIRADRAKALEEGVLRHAQTVPATIEYGGKRYKADVRLKGRLSDHWGAPDRWSLRVRLKKGETIDGFSQFSLQRPGVRQPPHDQIFQYWHRQSGNLSPDFRFYRVSVNGTYWGMMMAEEHMSRHFLELNARKESPLIKLGSPDRWYYENLNQGRLIDLAPVYYGIADIGIYHQSRYRDDDRMRALFSYAARAYRLMLSGEWDVARVMDVPSITRTLLMGLAWNNLHPLLDDNARYYLNPYTLRLEPVTTDQGLYWVFDGERPERNPPFVNAGFRLPPIYERLIRSPAFYAAFDQALRELAASLPSLDEEHARICSHFPFDCAPHVARVLDHNLAWLDSKGVEFLRDFDRLAEEEAVRRGEADAPPVEPTFRAIYPAHIAAEFRDDGRLRIYNLIGQDVVISSIRVVCATRPGALGGACEERSLLTDPFLIKAGLRDGLPRFADVQLPPMHLNRARRLRIASFLGADTKSIELSFTLRSEAMNPMLERPELPSLAERYPFFEVLDDRVKVAAGAFRVDDPIVLPEGLSLVLAAGANLSFAPDAYLLVRGPVFAEGTAEAPVVLAPVGASWKGLYVLEAGERSLLRHTVIENTGFFEDGALQLTGGVTFYRSDVTLEDVRFDGSVAEDALNTVQSDFLIRRTTFRTARSDAFDADFSTGRVEDSLFEDIAGDGLDTSGSQVTGQALVFRRITDKGVSVGEGSDVSLRSVRAEDVGTGAVSKDGSTLTIEGLEVDGFSVSAGMAYQKKGFYGPSSLSLTDTDLPRRAFRSGLDNSVTLDGEVVPGEALDIEALYSEGPMKKIRRDEDRRI